MDWEGRVVVVTVLALRCLSAHRGTARTVPGPSRQQEPPQSCWQRLALALRVGKEVAEVEGCRILEDSLLEERNGSIGVKHPQSILLAGSELAVAEDCLEGSIQVVDITLTGRHTAGAEIPQDRGDQSPAGPERGLTPGYHLLLSGPEASQHQ